MRVSIETWISKVMEYISQHSKLHTTANIKWINDRIKELKFLGVGPEVSGMIIAQEYTRHRACVRSGYCCKQAPCTFGEVKSPDSTQCKHLKGKKPGIYYCGIYEWIQQQPGNELSPAFNTECCSPLNSDRQRIIEVKSATWRI